MTVDNQHSGVEHTFSDGKELTIGEKANGQYGWWIDTPGSPARVSSFDPRSATCISFPDCLLQGEQPTFDAAVQAGMKAWKDMYGLTGG